MRISTAEGLLEGSCSRNFAAVAAPFPGDRMAHAASHEQNGSKEDGRVNEGAGGMNEVMSRELPGGERSHWRNAGGMAADVPE